MSYFAPVSALSYFIRISFINKFDRKTKKKF